MRKNRPRRIRYDKGETAPMEKNVLVVDEDGKEYGATYPKRAKGLVKHGRARFIDENTICLACPPSEISEFTEDSTMSDNTYIEQAETTAAETVQTAAPEMTVEYILGEIRAIRESDAYIYQAIEELKQVNVIGPGDIGSQAIASAIATTVRDREETNRKLIEFYSNIYNRLTAEDKLRDKCLDIIEKAVNNPAGFGAAELEAISNLLDSVRHINH